MIETAPRKRNCRKIGGWKNWMLCPISNQSSPTVSEQDLNQLELHNDWYVECYNSFDEGREAWQQMAASHNLFLSTEYFRLIEQLDLGGVSSGLAIFKHPEHGTFGLVLQTFMLDLGDQMGKLDQNADVGFWNGIVTGITQKMAHRLRFNVLTAGQLLLTGPNGIKASPSLDKKELTFLLSEGLEAIANQLPKKIHGIMLKDLDLGQHPEDNRFHPLPVQPNMILDVKPSWSSFDDYLGAMSSKYRIRVRRARKKGKNIERKELELEDLKLHQQEMHSLYKKIATQAEFNTAVLPADYFFKWKKHFPTRFRVWGYFIDEKLIGFSSAVYNGHEFEAHYIGFEQQYNRSHQLYLNMLYDFVEEAIVSESASLIFCRTALEIKSSVGAEAKELHCWLKTRVKGSNAVVAKIAQLIAPPQEWQARHPFKE